MDGALISAIEGGLLVYLGIAPDAAGAELEWFARKVSVIRIFEGAGDREGQMDRAAGEAGSAVLVVSQFTLYADTRKGRRSTRGRRATHRAVHGRAPRPRPRRG